MPLSAYRNRSKTFGRKSTEMQMPLSTTITSTCELTRSRLTCTLPPRGVYFTAFERRFQATCCKRYGSPDTRAGLFFFQAEDGIRDGRVTGVQTCALPI